MSAAISLRMAGIDVDLIDIDPDWRAAGAGLTLNGATLRALGQLGVVEDVIAGGHVHAGRRVFHSDGALISDVPAYRPASGDLTAMGGILRPVLHSILSRRVIRLGTAVRLGATVDVLDQTDDGVRVVFSDGRIGRYDLVVGADGIMSTVRRLLMPEARAPAFTGQGCWRAIFDRPEEVETNWLFVDPNRKVGFNPVSDAQMYMFMLESAPGNPWQEPSQWSATLAQKMRGFGGLVGRLAEQVSDATSTNYRPLETLLVPGPWHRGRAVLIGDAVHATTPHAGYGAGLAIEDAIVLSEELARHHDTEDALLSYAARRYDRCRGVLEGSVGLGELEMSGAPVEGQLAASARLFAFTRQPF
jgi:2-polyprenyl-6-methoxyphenol hydroxylase-like FAD-dependent oxidoreductase